MKLKSLKSIPLGIKNFFINFSRSIYNPRSNTILSRTPKDFSLTCCFYILTYAAMGLIAAICISVFSLLSINSRNDRIPINTIVLSRNLGLLSITYRNKLPKYNNNSSSTYNLYVDEITDSLLKYETIWNRTSKNMSSKFNRNSLGPCGTGDYGFSTYSPCFYIRMTKILNYVPKTLDGQDSPYIQMTCSSNYNDTKIEVYPSTGFPKDAFPVHEDGIPPLVAIKVTHIVKTIKIACKVNVEGLGVVPKPQTPPGSIEITIEY